MSNKKCKLVDVKNLIKSAILSNMFQNNMLSSLLLHLVYFDIILCNLNRIVLIGRAWASERWDKKTENRHGCRSSIQHICMYVRLLIQCEIEFISFQCVECFDSTERTSIYLSTQAYNRRQKNQMLEMICNEA